MLRELQQKRAALIAKMRAMLDENKGKSLTTEEETKFNADYKALKDEVSAFDVRIEQVKEVEGLEKDLELPDGKEHKANPGQNADPSFKEEEKLDDGGFKNVGEFLNAVKFGDKTGRLQKLSTSDAGILIPPQFSKNIMKLDGEDEIVMPRANVIPAGDPPDAPFTIPYLQQGADGALGGVSLTWTGEAQVIPPVNDPEIKDLTLSPQECSGLATINNKTLVNWQASGAFMQNLMRMAWVNGRDSKFLGGSGVGCPLGIRRSPGAIKINRTTTSTFGYVDALNMLAALYAGPGEPVWIINQTLMPTIMTMQDPNGNYIYNGGDAKKGVPATLLGIPVKWNGKTPTLGNEGDVTLAKLNYYMIKEGSGPFVALSEHFRFNTNQTVFRIVANIDGQLWVKDPLTLEDGSTQVSPVVILRA